MPPGTDIDTQEGHQAQLDFLKPYSRAAWAPREPGIMSNISVPVWGAPVWQKIVEHPAPLATLFPEGEWRGLYSDTRSDYTVLSQANLKTGLCASKYCAYVLRHDSRVYKGYPDGRVNADQLVHSFKERQTGSFSVLEGSDRLWAPAPRNDVFSELICERGLFSSPNAVVVFAML